MDSKTALDVLLSPEQRRKDAIAERRARSIQVMLVFISVIIVLIWVWAFMRTLNQPKIGSVGISNMRVVGAEALCPGDILQIEYDLRADGAGLLDLDATVWRIAEPPKTIVFSDSRRFVLVDTVDQLQSEAWVVPEMFMDSAIAREMRLLPGDYVRHIAISSPTRPTILTLGSVEFSVKNDCSQE